MVKNLFLFLGIIVTLILGILCFISLFIEMKVYQIKIFENIFAHNSYDLSENKIKVESKYKANASNHIPSIHKLNIQILNKICEKHKVNSWCLNKNFIHKFYQIKLISFLSSCISYINNREQIEKHQQLNLYSPKIWIQNKHSYR